MDADFKVIYRDMVVKPIVIEQGVDKKEHEENTARIIKPKFISVSFVNKNGEVVTIHDEECMFKFVRQ